jgi:hypothetical protein
MNNAVFRASMLYLIMLPASLIAHAEFNEELNEETSADKESPWLITPTLSSDPKLGNSLGAMVGYVFKIDEDSPSSMVAAMGNYSDTDSSVVGIFGRTYFGADTHRVVAGVMHGKIENEYEDFLGTGLEGITTDDLNIRFASYTNRLKDDWFVGAQLISMNYDILTDDPQTQKILDATGLKGLKSNGVGLVVEHDTRDTQNSPQAGSRLSFKQIAFREGLGGDESFDRYTLEYAKFIKHGNGHVIAGRFNGGWTNDAPVGGYSSIQLRGYTRGEYLAPNTLTFEVEERYAISQKIGATAFVGVACLYGAGASCNDSENQFPAAGAGLTYMLKQEERMIVRSEFAVGKKDNYGFYIQFGNAF